MPRPPGTGGRTAPAPIPAAWRSSRSRGIGPPTAVRLRAAGVADVAALAAASDEELAQLRIRAGWRDQARALIGAR